MPVSIYIYNIRFVTIYIKVGLYHVKNVMKRAFVYAPLENFFNPVDVYGFVWNILIKLTSVCLMSNY